MANEAFESGKPSQKNIEISRVVERAIRKSRALYVESLCIIGGSKVWNVRVDIHTLDDCGNLVDCCSIATISALLSARHEAVTLEGNTIKHPLDENETVPLSVHHIPVSVSFGLFNDNNKAIAIIDPTEREEQVMDGSISIAINKFNEICGIQKGGGAGLTSEELFKLIGIASERANEITGKIVKAVESSREKNKRQNESSLVEQ